MDAIREEFAVCDVSHLAEFNSLYYADRRQLIDLIKQNAPPAEAVLMQQDLLEALQRDPTSEHDGTPISRIIDRHGKWRDANPGREFGSADCRRTGARFLDILVPAGAC